MQLKKQEILHLLPRWQLTNKNGQPLCGKSSKLHLIVIFNEQETNNFVQRRVQIHYLLCIAERVSWEGYNEEYFHTLTQLPAVWLGESLSAAIYISISYLQHTPSVFSFLILNFILSKLHVWYQRTLMLCQSRTNWPTQPSNQLAFIDVRFQYHQHQLRSTGTDHIDGHSESRLTTAQNSNNGRNQRFYHLPSQHSARMPCPIFQRNRAASWRKKKWQQRGKMISIRSGRRRCLYWTK